MKFRVDQSVTWASEDGWTHARGGGSYVGVLGISDVIYLAASSYLELWAQGGSNSMSYSSIWMAIKRVA